MPPALVKNGFKVVDPGRFDLPANNFSPEIAAFKAEESSRSCWLWSPDPISPCS